MRKWGTRFNFKVVMTALLGTLLIAGTASAKSLYVIASINRSPSPIHTYDIQGAPNYLVFQAGQSIPFRGGGAVGIALDSDSAKLFVTYEVSNVIQLVDATTFADLGTTTAPGASNLSGIVVDQGKSRVYTIDRFTNNLYVYDWDATTDTLTLVPGGTGPGGSFVLSGVSFAYGIALDETRDRLYIADNSSNTVRYFETTNFTEAGNITLATHRPISIAVDQSRNFLYTGASVSGDRNLVKYDLNTDTETAVSIETSTGGTASEGVIGVAVDEDTGYVYVTTGFTGDRLLAFDSNLAEVKIFSKAELQAFDATNLWGDPTGIAIPRADISFNPLNFSKDSNTGGTGEVGSGQNLTYDLCYDNTANTNPVNNVVITDAVPTGATFVSATGGGTLAAGTVTWTIGNLAAGAPQACVQLVLNITAAEGGTVTNTATIDSDDTPPTSQTDVVDVVAGGTDVDVVGTGGGSATGPLEIVLLMSGLGALLARRRKTMRKQHKAALGALLVAGGAMALSPVANAANPFYVGASGGIAQASYSATDLVNALPGYTLSNVSVDDSDTGWKLFAGWQFHPNFAVEAAYVDLGEIKSSYSATAVPDVQQLLDDTAAIHPYMANGFTLAGVASYNINPKASVMGKVGLFSWDAEADITEINTGANSKVDQDGTDLMFGLGAKYMVTPQWGIRAEWESYDLDWDRVDFFSLGAEIHF